MFVRLCTLNENVKTRWSPPQVWFSDSTPSGHFHFSPPKGCPLSQSAPHSTKHCVARPTPSPGKTRMEGRESVNKRRHSVCNTQISLQGMKNCWALDKGLRSKPVIPNVHALRIHVRDKAVDWARSQFHSRRKFMKTRDEQKVNQRKNTCEIRVKAALARTTSASCSWSLPSRMLRSSVNSTCTRPDVSRLLGVSRLKLSNLNSPSILLWQQRSLWFRLYCWLLHERKNLPNGAPRNHFISTLLLCDYSK